MPVKHLGPRVYPTWRIPSYPRLVGVGVMVVAGACSRSAAQPDAGTPIPGGTPVMSDYAQDAAHTDAGSAASTDATTHAVADGAADAGTDALPDATKRKAARPPARPGGAPDIDFGI